MNAIQIAEIAEEWVKAKLDAYIQKVAEVYSLSVDDLKTLAHDVAPNCEAEKVVEKKKLMKLKKSELQDKCKELGHRVSGNKEVLVDRILSGKVDTPATKKQPKSKPKTSASEIRVAQSAHGNYVYDGLVIDKGTRMVVGIETADGKIGPLTKDGIDKCHRYKLKFAIPINMNDNRVHVEDDENEEEKVQVDDEEHEEEEDDEEDEDEEDEDEDEEDEEDEDLEVEEEVEVEVEEEVEEEVEVEVDDEDDDIEYVYDE